MTDPVSGGGAISDEELAKIPETHRLRASGVGSGHCIACRAVWPCEAIGLKIRLDASEARAEAAERERDEWKEAALYENARATEGMWNNLRLKGELATAESRLAATDAVVEAAREWRRYMAAHGVPIAVNDAALCEALAALDAQPQPTPSPEEEK